MHYTKISKNMEKALRDMESFTSGSYNFVYRYGIVTSQQDEGRLLAFFDANTEGDLNHYIKLLDNKFHKYTDTLVDRTYDADQECWYATYAVLYPFDNSVISGKFDGQCAAPLF